MVTVRTVKKEHWTFMGALTCLAIHYEAWVLAGRPLGPRVAFSLSRLSEAQPSPAAAVSTVLVYIIKRGMNI